MRTAAEHGRISAFKPLNRASKTVADAEVFADSIKCYTF